MNDLGIMSLLRSRKLANLTNNFHTLFVIYVASKSGVLDSLANGNLGEFRKAKGNSSEIVDSIIEAGFSCGLWNKDMTITPFGAEFTKNDPNGYRAWVMGLVELQSKMLGLVPDLVGERRRGSNLDVPYNYENTSVEEVGIASAAEGMAKFLGFRCIDRVNEFQRDHCSVLDIGCGNGEYLLHLAESNLTLEGLGIETSSALVEVARQKVSKLHLDSIQSSVEAGRRDQHSRIKIVEGDFLTESIDLGNSSFDVCLLNFVLHYFSKKDRIRVFSRCARLLKENGKIVILEPVLEEFGRKQRVEFAAFNLNLYPQNTTFHGLPRISEMNNALRSSRFEIVRRIKPFPVGPVMCYVAMRVPTLP